VPKGEEVLVPYPAPRDRVPVVRRIRSGLLCSSLQAVRARHLESAYFAKLPREYHERVLSLTAAEWIGPELAFAHYDALDALGMTPEQIEQNGLQVAQQLQRGFLSVVLRFAVESGVTPWAVLERYQKLWERYFDGSAVAVWKRGPKEARAQVAGFPLARIGYVQVGVGGIMRGVLELVCRRAYVVPMRTQSDATTLTYRISWA
jgi:hypothetical protein